VGYDDLPVARWVGPELTTVHQPLAAMADAATRLLLTLASGATPPALRVDLAVHLVVRGSTAPPRVVPAQSSVPTSRRAAAT
jgi:LacI family xylobiose transport system transcriptional regulator